MSYLWCGDVDLRICVVELTGLCHEGVFHESRRARVNQGRAPVIAAPAERMASPAVTPVWLPIVEKSVFRFDGSESARKEAAPSISFEYPRLREEEIDTSSFESNEPQIIPVFEFNGENQVVTVKVSICLRVRYDNFRLLRFLF